MRRTKCTPPQSLAQALPGRQNPSREINREMDGVPAKAGEPFRVEKETILPPRVWKGDGVT